MVEIWKAGLLSVGLAAVGTWAIAQDAPAEVPAAVDEEAELVQGAGETPTESVPVVEPFDCGDSAELDQRLATTDVDTLEAIRRYCTDQFMAKAAEIGGADQTTSYDIIADRAAADLAILEAMSHEWRRGGPAEAAVRQLLGAIEDRRTRAQALAENDPEKSEKLLAEVEGLQKDYDAALARIETTRGAVSDLQIELREELEVQADELAQVKVGDLVKILEGMSTSMERVVGMIAANNELAPTGDETE